MSAFLVCRDPSGDERVLSPGDVIGRAWNAALRVDDPRVSEAHALVSLRADRLKLLALRGRFAVDGRVVSELDLDVGQRVALAPGLELEVLDVSVPAEILAVWGSGLPVTALPGAVAIRVGSEPSVVHPTSPDAVCWLWEDGDVWRLRESSGAVHAVGPGVTFEAGGRRFELGLIPVASTAPTADRSVLRAPLRVVARYETVHVHRPGQPPVVLDGLMARLVSELVSFQVPVAWTVLAAQLWDDVQEPMIARKRLDGVLGRVRARLRAGGMRVDLVRTNGLGQVELFLEPDDVVEDQL